MIEIDGSLGEGGGQILRTSLALAAVLGREIRVFNIRSGRPEPGLKAQHLTSAKAVAEACGASSDGLEIGSTHFVFTPFKLRSGSFRFDVGTAGSVTLVLQTLMPLLPFSPGRTTVEIHGGTDVSWSPPIDYLRLVTIPLLAGMGVNLSIEGVRRGHYPRGGGLMRVVATPSGMLKPIIGLNRGEVSSVIGVSHAVGLPRHVAERQANSASSILTGNGLLNVHVDREPEEKGSELGVGSGIVLCARTNNSAILGADSLGERGRPAEEVGAAAAKLLLEEVRSGSFLDRHMGDMIVPFMALASGESEVSVSQITQHTLTNVRIAETLAGVRFDPVVGLGRPGRIRVRGLGWES